MPILELKSSRPIAGVYITAQGVGGPGSHLYCVDRGFDDRISHSRVEWWFWLAAPTWPPLSPS